MKITSVLACLAATALAATALVATATVAPAQAAPAPQKLTTCGQIITGESAYLDQDLTCAQGFVTPRAVDGSNRLSIDLRGHRLSGTGDGIPFYVGNNDPYHDSLEVQNGRVDHWGTAFFAAYASIKITNVTIDHNELGLYCGGSTCAVTESRISDNGAGTTSNDSLLTFDQNVFSRNGVASDAAFAGISASTFTKNAFEANAVGVRVAGTGSITATQNVFTRNDVGLQGGTPSESDSYRAELTSNTFTGNRTGVHLRLRSGYDTATLKGNVALRNTGYGIYAPGATDLGGNLAAANGRICLGIACQHPQR